MWLSKEFRWIVHFPCWPGLLKYRIALIGKDTSSKIWIRIGLASSSVTGNLLPFTISAQTNTPSLHTHIDRIFLYISKYPSLWLKHYSWDRKYLHVNFFFIWQEVSSCGIKYLARGNISFSRQSAVIFVWSIKISCHLGYQDASSGSRGKWPGLQG